MLKIKSTQTKEHFWLVNVCVENQLGIHSWTVYIGILDFRKKINLKEHIRISDELFCDLN